MNPINSKRSDPHRLTLNLTDKYVALSNLSMYYTWKNIKKSYKNNKFKISAPTWNGELELHNGSYSISDIQDHFEYVLRNTEKKLLIFNKTESCLKLNQEIILNF